MEGYAAGLAVVVTGIAAVTDIRLGRIPNALTVPAAVLGIVLHGALSGVPGLGWAFAGLLGMGIPLILAYLFIPITPEAGDIKLLIALAAIAGWPYCWVLLLLTLLWGGVASLVALAWRGRMWSTVARTLRIFFAFVVPNLEPEAPVEPGAEGVTLPYAVPMCLAAITVLADTVGWIALPGLVG